MKGEGLGTIFEEIDLSERIQALKGKKIRIKRMVRKEDGSYSLKESFVQAEESLLPAGPQRLGRSLRGQTGDSRQRFRSGERRAGEAAPREMRSSVFYERLVGGRRPEADRMYSSYSSMRQSASLSRALCLEEEEAGRLPPLALKVEAGLEADAQAAEEACGQSLASIQLFFSDLFARLTAAVESARDSLISRVKSHHQRLQANLQGFSSLLQQFRDEEAGLMANAGKAVCVCRAVRLFDAGRLVREEPLNALLLAQRVRIESLKRLIAFAAERWPTLGGGECSFADSATAREAVAAEAAQIEASLASSLKPLEDFLHRSELGELGALSAAAEVEPLATPSRMGVVCGRSAGQWRAPTVFAPSADCLAVNDRLQPWAAQEEVLLKYAAQRRCLEPVERPHPFLPSQLHCFSSYPEPLAGLGPAGRSVTKREYLLYAQPKGAGHTLGLWDPLAATRVQEFLLSAAPRCLLALKDSFTFLAALPTALLFFSATDPQPLQSLDLPAAPRALHLSSNLFTLHALLDDRTVLALQLSYAFSAQCGRTVFAGAEELGSFVTPDQLLELSELAFNSSCLLALTAEPALQLLSAPGLQPLETLHLPRPFDHMRLVEEAEGGRTLVVLSGGDTCAIYSLAQRQIVFQARLPDGCCATGPPLFALVPALHLLLPAAGPGEASARLLALSL